MTAKFFPYGWDHLKTDFVVPLSGIPGWVERDFARVRRDTNGHAFEVWFCGIGETFFSAAQAVHHLRFLARVVGNSSGR